MHWKTSDRLLKFSFLIFNDIHGNFITIFTRRQNRILNCLSMNGWYCCFVCPRESLLLHFLQQIPLFASPLDVFFFFLFFFAHSLHFIQSKKLDLHRLLCIVFWLFFFEENLFDIVFILFDSRSSATTLRRKKLLIFNHEQNMDKLVSWFSSKAIHVLW